MNEYRGISAKSQHNFHILPHFNSKTTEPISPFLHDLEQLVELLTRAPARQWCISFHNTRATSEDGQFWRWQKSPKIYWLPWQRPCLLRNLCQFNNLHAWLYQNWNVGEDRFSSCWDIWGDTPIFAISTLAVQLLSFKTPGWLVQISPKKVGLIIYHSISTIRCKDCENRSSG